MASASIFWSVNASPVGLCILRSFHLYAILADFVSYAFLFTYLLECLLLWPHSIFLSLCFLNLFFPSMPSSSHCLYVFTVYIDLPAFLGLYPLFLACMPPVRNCLYFFIYRIDCLPLAYMPCSWPVCTPRFPTVCMSLYRFDCLTLGLYALFLACMPSSSPLSVCLDCLNLSYMPCLLASVPYTMP